MYELFIFHRSRSSLCHGTNSKDFWPHQNDDCRLIRREGGNEEGREAVEQWKICQKSGKEGENQEKAEKSRRNKSGKRGTENREGSFTLPLLTDRACYATWESEEFQKALNAYQICMLFDFLITLLRYALINRHEISQFILWCQLSIYNPDHLESKPFVFPRHRFQISQCDTQVFTTIKLFYKRPVTVFLLFFLHTCVMSWVIKVWNSY